MARRSPYLKDWRLADVIAAITVMSTYPYSSLRASAWVERLDQPHSAASWLAVFRDHPEFFRVSDEAEAWASLRLRHGFDRTYSARQKRELSFQELQMINPDSEEYKDLTRRPLTPGEIESLTKTAIELHASATLHEQERRWLSPLLFGLLGVVVGTVLQAALK